MQKIIAGSSIELPIFLTLHRRNKKNFQHGNTKGE